MVNGKQFVLDHLKDGETRSLDISSALHKGNNNRVTLAAHGDKNGESGTIILSDGRTAASPLVLSNTNALPTASPTSSPESVAEPESVTVRIANAHPAPHS